MNGLSLVQESLEQRLTTDRRIYQAAMTATNNLDATFLQSNRSDTVQLLQAAAKEIHVFDSSITGAYIAVPSRFSIRFLAPNVDGRARVEDYQIISFSGKERTGLLPFDKISESIEKNGLVITSDDQSSDSILLSPIGSHEHHTYNRGLLIVTYSGQVPDAIAFATTSLANSIGNRMQEFQSRYTDEHTGLLKRERHDIDYQTAVSNYLTKGIEFAYVFQDINGLKTYNDSYGYGAGDRLIELGAKSLLRSIRLAKDGAYRVFSGDEQAAIVYGVESSYMPELEARIRSNNRENSARIADPFTVNGLTYKNLPIPFSLAAVGVVHCTDIGEGQLARNSHQIYTLAKQLVSEEKLRLNIRR